VQIILYHPNGEAYPISEPRWRRALDLARDHGWLPQGTHAPRKLGPRPLECVPGCYVPAFSQEVIREDAWAFARALIRSGEPGWSSLCEFAGRAGFLICPPTPGFEVREHRLARARRLRDEDWDHVPAA